MFHDKSGGGVFDPAVEEWWQGVTFDMALVLSFDPSGPYAFPASCGQSVARVLGREMTETNSGDLRLLGGILHDLHTIFHDAARLGWAGGDDPRSVHGEIMARLSERIDALSAG